MALSKLTAAALAAGAAKENFGAGALLQIQTTVLNGQLASSVAGAPDTITNGVQVLGLNFTPLSATSKLLVQTSTIAVAEETNAGDMTWVALWNGSAFVSANSGTWLYTHFSGYLNGVYHNVHELFAAGSTASRLIQVRAGNNANGSNVYVNGNSGYNYNSINQQVRMTVMEIAG